MLVTAGEVRLEGVVQGDVNENFIVILQEIVQPRDSDSGAESFLLKRRLSLFVLSQTASELRE
jgi:hypothetical protein